MHAHYGEFPNTLGADGDPIDFYLGPDASERVFVVNQREMAPIRKDGRRAPLVPFDEHKVFIGFASAREAAESYKLHYQDVWADLFQSMRERSLTWLRRWLEQTQQSPLKRSLFFKSPYIGPKGGLYKDPERKVPYSRRAHGAVSPSKCPRCKGIAHIISRQKTIGGNSEASAAPCRTCNPRGKHKLDPAKVKAAGLPMPKERKRRRETAPPERVQPQRHQMKMDFNKPKQISMFKGETMPDLGPRDEAQQVMLEMLYKSLDPAPEKRLTDEQLRAHLATIKRAFGVELSFDEVRRECDAALSKAARGGKYIKRVPYFKDGKKKYRYYYSETSIARDVKEGETIKLGTAYAKVESVSATHIMLETGGRSIRVPKEDWGTFLSRHYGDRYHDWAAKRATQSVNAVLRLVPKALLKDLPDGDFETRMKALKLRVPRVYAKLEKAFQRAGIEPARARRILGETLERRGWAPSARAAVIGHALSGEKALSVGQVIRASENVAAGGSVNVGHVGTVIELSGNDLAKTTQRVAQKAEKEVAQLLKALQGAELTALQAALSTPAASALLQLVQAFPGIQDKAVAPAQAALGAAVAAAKLPTPKTRGSETPLFVAGEGGRPKALRARYRLMEAKDVRASHDPTQGFKRRDDYPEGVQERAYHRDQAEQLKVQRNAKTMNVEFLVNTNPDAVNGPPMVTPEGVALGGNSRAMSMQLAYQGETGAQLKAYLTKKANDFGFSAEDVSSMERPVLVREMIPETDAGYSKGEMQILVRQMNESFTQAMDPRTMQVAMGRKLDDKTVEGLADSMEDGETLASYLSSSRATGFINALRRNGIIDDRNSAQYLKDASTLNEDGKTLVERILVGRMVEDADLLSNTRTGLVGSVARAVPSMTQAQGYGEGYNLQQPLKTALAAYNDLKHLADSKAIPTLSSSMSHSEFARTVEGNLGGGLFGDAHEVTKDPRAKALLAVLIAKSGPRQMAQVFQDYALAAKEHPEGQGSMFGPAKTPEDVLLEVVNRATPMLSGAKAPEKSEAPQELRLARSMTGVRPEFLVRPTVGLTFQKGAKPPPGYSPMPNSKKGGYRKKSSNGWDHWYPDGKGNAFGQKSGDPESEEGAESSEEEKPKASKREDLQQQLEVMKHADSAKAVEQKIEDLLSGNGSATYSPAALAALKKEHAAAVDKLAQAHREHASMRGEEAKADFLLSSEDRLERVGLGRDFEERMQAEDDAVDEAESPPEVAKMTEALDKLPEQKPEEQAETVASLVEDMDPEHSQEALSKYLEASESDPQLTAVLKGMQAQITKLEKQLAKVTSQKDSPKDSSRAARAQRNRERIPQSFVGALLALLDLAGSHLVAMILSPARAAKKRATKAAKKEIPGKEEASEEQSEKEEEPAKKSAPFVGFLVKAKAPAGYSAIPGGKKGGFRKRVGGKWSYWYPDGAGGGTTRDQQKGEERPTKGGPKGSKPIPAFSESRATPGSALAELEAGGFPRGMVRTSSGKLEERTVLPDALQVRLLGQFEGMLQNAAKRAGASFKASRDVDTRRDLHTAALTGLLKAMQAYKGGQPFAPLAKQQANNEAQALAATMLGGLRLTKRQARLMGSFQAARIQAQKAGSVDDASIANAWNIRMDQLHGGSDGTAKGVPLEDYTTAGRKNPGKLSLVREFKALLDRNDITPGDSSEERMAFDSAVSSGRESAQDKRDAQSDFSRILPKLSSVEVTLDSGTYRGDGGALLTATLGLKDEPLSVRQAAEKVPLEKRSASGEWKAVSPRTARRVLSDFLGGVTKQARELMEGPGERKAPTPPKALPRTTRPMRAVRREIRAAAAQVSDAKALSWKGEQRRKLRQKLRGLKPGTSEHKEVAEAIRNVGTMPKPAAKKVIAMQESPLAKEMQQLTLFKSLRVGGELVRLQKATMSLTAASLMADHLDVARLLFRADAVPSNGYLRAMSLVGIL